MTQDAALRFLRPLRTALEKVRESPEHLSMVHSSFIRSCLIAKCYHAAVDILEENIYFLPSVKLHVEHLLLYYYYGGMVYIGLKRFDRALEFLAVCISTPAEAVSAIMVEAFKKYQLVSLILYGTTVSLPKYTSYVLRHLKQISSPYMELVEIYNKRTAAGLNALIERHSAVFERDKNMGLILQCRENLTRRNIKRLTETFMTLSLEAIALEIELETAKDAEAALVDMISDGEIFATIDQASGTVSFHDDTVQFESQGTIELLQVQIDSAVALYEKIANLDIELRTSHKFIRKSNPESAPGDDADSAPDPTTF